MERSLADIWQALLGVNHLSIHDNFFDIGGDSLLATRLFTQIGNVFGRRLSLDTIFEAPTIAELAELLEKGKERSADGPTGQREDGLEDALRLLGIS